MATVHVGIFTPRITHLLVTVLVAMFLLQLALGDHQGAFVPTTPALLAMGALFQPLVVEEHEWYRVIQAGFLHADLLHLVLNCVALWFGGVVLERWVGRWWLLNVFALSLVGGSAMSLLINSPDTISVGASGAIMGVLAAAMLIALQRLPPGEEQKDVVMSLSRLLIPALIPLTTGGSGSRIDYGAHFGGALVGALVGLAIVLSWRSDQPGPAHKRATSVVAIVSVVSMCGAAAIALTEQRAAAKLFNLATYVAHDSEFQNLEDLTSE